MGFQSGKIEKKMGGVGDTLGGILSQVEGGKSICQVLPERGELEGYNWWVLGGKKPEGEKVAHQNQ